MRLYHTPHPSSTARVKLGRSLTQRGFAINLHTGIAYEMALFYFSILIACL